MKQVCAECGMNSCVCDRIENYVEHEREINRKAAATIFELVDISEEDCRTIVKQIILGKIPNVFIKY